MWVRVGNRTYELSEIAEATPVTGTSFQDKVFQFIQSWQRGREQFSFKTSGSTGPKASISFSRAQLIYSAEQTQVALGLRPGSTALLCLDPDFIAGQMVIVRSLVAQMNLVITEPSSNPLSQVPDGVAIDYASFVPLQVAAMLDSDQRARMLNISCALVGGAPVADALKKSLSDSSGRWFVSYGMTETISHIALQALTGSEKSETFRALPNIHLKTDHRSCLVINADYLGSAPIATNDVVQMKSQNEFLWLGRLDNVINSGAYKVHPERVEERLTSWFEQNRLKRRFFVASLPHARLGEEVVLVIEGPPLQDNLIDSLNHRMQEILVPYEVPRHIYYLHNFVETPTGKVQRKATMKLLSVRSR